MTDPASQLWRVLIRFEEKKVSYLVHTPTEEQQRGYRYDRLYLCPDWHRQSHHLMLFTDAPSATEAKAKARQLLLDYVQKEPV